MNNAVHFGAGNIGRGFIGELFYKSNFHTTFVDVNEEIIDEINRVKEYKVVLLAEEKEELLVKNISGINSMKDPEKVIEAIVNADVITTAVGASILPAIAEIIAKGLSERVKQNPTPLNLIACENMIGGSEVLKEAVYQTITDEEKSLFDQTFGFPNAAVDRIVPNQTNEDLLTVSVEPYFEWIVEGSSVKGTNPDVKGITYVDDLTPYIERKLFTVNTGHAVPAYLGKYLGYHTINEAMNDERVKTILEGVLSESGEALIKTYNFDPETHQNYIDKIVQRFMNPYISDEVTRVARGSVRKLGPQDRLIRPASMYMDVVGKTPKHFSQVIAAVLEYKDDNDQEAMKVQDMIEEVGYEKTLQTISKLEDGNPLIVSVMTQLEELKTLKK